MVALTVIMHTNGCYPKYIGAAVHSVLNQTYLDFELLINNGHPFSNLVLDKEYDNVRIINKPYKNFIQQMASSFKHINTPYWCMIDSDDFVMPNHLEQLMRHRFSSTYAEYNCIGVPLIMKTVKGKPQKLIRASWVRFIYNWIDPDVIQKLADEYKREYGFDQAIDQLSLWNRKILSGTVDTTYMYRRKEAGHVSDRKRFLESQRDPKEIPTIIPKPFRDDFSIFQNHINHLPIGKPEDEQTQK